MDSFTFCSENSVQNSKSGDNFSIRSRNKIGKRFHKDFVSKIPSVIETPKPPQDKFSPVIPSGITPPITMGTNSKIYSGDIFPIPSRSLSNITEDRYAAFYNSASLAPTNPKVQLVKLDPTTYVKSNSDYISKTTITPHIKLSNSNIFQHIWSLIFNNKQDPKDLKRCNGNENHWCKAKENWAAAISAVHCDFMLKSY